MAKKIWLAGATGYIGRALGRELVNRGYAVTALVRPRAAGKEAFVVPDGMDCLEVDVTSAVALRSTLESRPVDIVYSCLASRSGVAEDAWRIDCEANRHLLAVAEQAGAQQFVLLSAICVQRPRLAFQQAKLAFERELQASALQWSIVRPTAFFKSLAGQVERVQEGKPFLMFGDGTLTACKPISEEDLACYLADCIANPLRVGRVLPIGGPGPAITPRDQGELLCRLAGKPAKLSRVPLALFKVLGALLWPLGLVSKRMAQKAELVRIGHYYASESMLLWDETAQRYDAQATPETGADTLEAFYRRVLADGLEGQELGDAKLF